MTSSMGGGPPNVATNPQIVAMLQGGQQGAAQGQQLAQGPTPQQPGGTPGQRPDKLASHLETLAEGVRQMAKMMRFDGDKEGATSMDQCAVTIDKVAKRREDAYEQFAKASQEIGATLGNGAGAQQQAASPAPAQAAQ